MTADDCYYLLTVDVNYPDFAIVVVLDYFVLIVVSTVVALVVETRETATWRVIVDHKHSHVLHY